MARLAHTAITQAKAGDIVEFPAYVTLAFAYSVTHPDGGTVYHLVDGAGRLYTYDPEDKGYAQA